MAGAPKKYRVSYFELVEHSLDIVADSPEQAIAEAEKIVGSGWAGWDEESHGANGAEVVSLIDGDEVTKVYDTGTRSGFPASGAVLKGADVGVVQ